ncbi:hypothetical protein [Adlercreutzia sp. ZJ154]|uniref:hypothetical protein n=1 Tax=Adlercreutzia sp. ZJ154 TaxID=2709790 RepID=UPI0013EC89CC|nr:hypothetical protein [Adlercreutzia sp. ZJ154]
MKKTSKLIGALGLSAALIVGTALPAFAVESDENGIVTAGTDVSSTDSAGQTTGETTVYMAATQTQISATIPLAIAVYAPSAGGELTTPRESAYTITNNSENAKLYVSKVESTLLPEAPSNTSDVNWTAAKESTLDEALSTLPTTAYNSTSNFITISGSNAAASAKYGTVFVNLTAGQLSDKAYDEVTKTEKAYGDGNTYIKKNMLNADNNVVPYDGVESLVLAGGSNTSDANSGYKSSHAVNWEMEANNVDKTNLDSQIGLRLEGYASQLNIGSTAGQLTSDTLVQLMKITYTVQASSAHVGAKNMVQTKFEYPSLAV